MQAKAKLTVRPSQNSFSSSEDSSSSLKSSTLVTRKPDANLLVRFPQSRSADSSCEFFRGETQSWKISTDSESSSIETSDSFSSDSAVSGDVIGSVSFIECKLA